MKIVYEKTTQDCGQDVVQATHEDGKIFWIPADESNSDYQRYLRWLENPDAEGGETL